MNDLPEERLSILYFGNDWQTDNRTSSHHIARWLSRRFQVYYIECPGLRPPRTSSRDLKKVWVKLWRFFRGARQVENGIKVRTLLQIPLHRYRFIRWLNRHLVTTTLRWLIWRERIGSSITWFMVPHLSSLVGKLGEKLSVYYCTDDHKTMPDVDSDAIQLMDEELTRKADLVFVTAESLLTAKVPLNPNTHFAPHGVDVELFGQAQDSSTKIPADAAGFRNPVIGFFGLIEEWIDLELIDYLAKERPSWTFLLVGRVAVPEARLPTLPNVHFLGKRPYESLPAYGKKFDVAIIPFQLTPVILHANPLKLREYLAMGKPIVSVSTPEIDRYADVVALAHSRQEFLTQLDRILARPPEASDIQRYQDRVARESWEARLQEVLRIVSDQLPASSRQLNSKVAS